MNEISEHKHRWGDDERVYECDDRDRRKRNSLRIRQGGNGDWYVTVAPVESGGIGCSVRLCTSGGASSMFPGLTVAIADAYRALGGEPTSREETQAALAAAKEEVERLREAVTGKIGVWMSIQEALAYIATGQGDRGDVLTEWAKDYSAQLEAALKGDQPNA